jgi:signal transduction histidine kinase
MNGLVVPLRLLPSTMFGRLAGSLLLVVGVTLAVVVALVLRDRGELSIRVGGVGDTSHRIEWLTHRLEELHGDARTAERRRLIADPDLKVAPEPYPGRTLSTHEVAAIKRAFVAELRDRLGDNYKIDVGRIRSMHHSDVIPLVPEENHVSGTTALDVAVELPDGDTLVFRVAPPMPDPPLPWPLFIQLGVLTLVLAVVLFLVTRSITRPLSKLAHAADGVGRNVRHPPLAEEGVREIREATRAFNTMQDRLLRYLDSRTSVLAAMSHDLRTPLTRLRLRVESVADEQLYTRFVADLDEMEGLVRGALGVLKGLEDDEAFEQLDVNTLLETLVAEYAELGSDVSLEGRARDLANVKPRALKRCLTNLVDNALKFGKRAIIDVNDDGEALVIHVSDEGPGIAEEFLERVFEPFYRLEVSRSRDTGGTGLGLSIARDIAQAHGGTLTLRNRTGGGLTAELRLPRK